MAAKDLGTVPGMDEMPEKLRAAKEDFKNIPSEFMADLKKYTPSGLEAGIEKSERAKLKERMRPEIKKKGGKVCGMKKGGAVNARGCGCAQRGLTKGKMV